MAMALFNDDLRRALDPVLLARACGIEPDPWQAAVLRTSAPRLLLNCCRQSGKSTVCALRVLHTALYEPGSLSVCLSPSERQSGEFFRKVSEGFRALGRPVKALRENTLELELANGSRVVALPGKEGTIRGFSGVSLLVVDEAARVADDLYRAVRPMLAVSGGLLQALSTPFGRRGWFHDAWANGGRGWERVEVTADQCPRITPEFLAEERRALGEEWFRQEFFCRFVEAVGGVFTYERVMDALSEEVETL